MLVSEFDYQLPEELIAQEPLADRAASRMLHLVRAAGSWEDRHFRDLPELLCPEDLLVVNNTRVVAARLYGRRAGVRAQKVSPRNPASREFLLGRVEVLLTKPLSQGSVEGQGFSLAAGDAKKEGTLAPEANPLVWEALVHPGRKIGVGERLFFGENNELEAEVIARGTFGERTLRFAPVPDFLERVERLGHVPLPPYIDRPDRPEDRDRYQTVYARERGSVAAPTAGLHFTPEILVQIRERGVEIAELTLHVGLGTFQPVHAERVEDHRMHSEWYSVSEEAAGKINRALEAGRRVVAVGTTTVRTLEFAASTTGRVEAGKGEANLFLYPGFQFRVVGAMLTNFHLPKSTLLMLVSAFAGRELVLEAYEHAVHERYRFYSYGDCVFIE